jgi:hypothetical protein
MQVLMLGWEYPPHISGGLGTACEGLTTALAPLDVDIQFVVPQLYGVERAPHMRLVSPALRSRSAPITPSGEPIKTHAASAQPSDGDGHDATPSHTRDQAGIEPSVERRDGMFRRCAFPRCSRPT